MFSIKDLIDTFKKEGPTETAEGDLIQIRNNIITHVLIIYIKDFKKDRITDKELNKHFIDISECLNIINKKLKTFEIIESIRAISQAEKEELKYKIEYGFDDTDEEEYYNNIKEEINSDSEEDSDSEQEDSDGGESEPET